MDKKWETPEIISSPINECDKHWNYGDNEHDNENCNPQEFFES